MKYIDADRLQKEIERQIMGIIKKQDANPDIPKHRWYLYEGMKEAFNDIGGFIDSLQQEQPEVDLEKEYKTWWDSITGKINVEHMMEWYMHETARHFYELGLNARKKK